MANQPHSHTHTHAALLQLQRPWWVAGEDDGDKRISWRRWMEAYLAALPEQADEARGEGPENGGRNAVLHVGRPAGGALAIHTDKSHRVAVQRRPFT
ncbi:hypothetical protein E2562_010015 [Oryza meyeriana var. granulata]|uniref:Uncharacterized protein n=1 Tax=Oryza meyeriana var. granulata TaxID=110450 RepID=A0A6G1EHM4_9ORYZ|nr:hypothetical protein E2562_010015 [Oryza meyeriana var. granulata]